MKGYQLLKKINKNKINPGTKFRIKHTDGNIDQDMLIRYDLDENGYGALYTEDKVINKSYICDSSFIINNDFYALKDNIKRENMFLRSIKDSFIPSVYFWIFILLLFYLITVNSNINWVYSIVSLIFTIIIYISTVFLELTISLKCKRNRFGQFNLDVDRKLRGKKYSEIINYYKSELLSIDQLNERKVYLDSFNIDRGLIKLSSIAVTVVLTWIFNYICQIFSKSSNTQSIQYFIGTMFFIVAISPVIFKYLKLLKITADYPTSSLELNIINKLIEKKEQQELNNLY